MQDGGKGQCCRTYCLEPTLSGPPWCAGLTITVVRDLNYGQWFAQYEWTKRWFLSQHDEGDSPLFPICKPEVPVPALPASQLQGENTLNPAAAIEPANRRIERARFCSSFLLSPLDYLSGSLPLSRSPQAPIILSLAEHPPGCSCACPADSAAAGAMAGATGWVIIFPIDTMKTRLQTRQATEPTYRIMDCARDMWKESPRGRAFTRGLGVCLVRSIPVNAVTFLTYEAVMALGQRLHESC